MESLDGRMVKVTLLCLLCALGGFSAGWLVRMGVTKRSEEVERIIVREGYLRLSNLLKRYHDIHGSFPPMSRAPDWNGEHSWRTALCAGFYNEPSVEWGYHFSEAWNSPSNKMVTRDIEQWGIFSLNRDQAMIAHLLALGPTNTWPVPEMPLMAYLVEKNGDRLLLVGNPDSDIHWTEPRY